MTAALAVFALLLSLLPFKAFAVACPPSDTLAIISSPCTVSGSQSTFELNFISGFTDATSLTAVDGNPGDTVGKQRQYAFIKAAEILAGQINSTVTIVLDARFSALTCTATQAVLGSAGATNNFSHPSPPSGISANTFYPVSLYSAISQTDEDVGVSDISAEFNKNVGNAGCLQASDGWYYGFGVPSVSDIGFTTVLLHELTHGLGFASLVDASSGAKASGQNDVFSNLLFDTNLGAWPSLSNAQRAASANSGDGLLWDGSQVNTQAQGKITLGFKDNDSSGNFTSGDKIQMYAPNPVEEGSSISHFDTSVAPNELMEPEYTEGQYGLGLALYLLQDLGWSIAPSNNTAPIISAVNQSMMEDTTLLVDMSSWATDNEGGPLSFSVDVCADNINCSINGALLTLTPDANHNGTTHAITIEVQDSIGATSSDSFNLAVSALNDYPTWTSFTDKNLTLGNSLNVDLNLFSDDVDGDSLSFNIVSCPASTSCTLNNTTITVSAVNGAGTQALIKFAADDNLGGITEHTFNLNIFAPTQIEHAGSVFNHGDTLSISLVDEQINITGGSSNFDLSLTYLGVDVNSLLTLNAQGLIIALPASGAFAGEYTLNVQDTTTGDLTTLIIHRPLRLSFSATSILHLDDTQTLSIEGGIIGSEYLLSQSAISPFEFVDSNDNPQSSFNASNNPATFNAALVGIHSATTELIDLSEIELTVSTLNESYEDVSQSLLLYPTAQHSFVVSDTLGDVIAGVNVSLNGSDLLTALNIPLIYQADNLGVFSVALPNIDEDFTVTVSAQDFNSATFTFDNSQLTHAVQMSSMVNAITLSGTLKALGLGLAAQDFLSSPPTLNLVFSDDSQELITLTVNTKSQANFSHSVDLNQHTPSHFIIMQSDSLSLTQAISQTSEDRSFDLFLESSLTDDSTATTLGSSGGGTLPLYWLLLFTLVTHRKRQAF